MGYSVKLVWNDGIEDRAYPATVEKAVEYIANEQARVGKEMDYPSDLYIEKATIVRED